MKRPTPILENQPQSVHSLHYLVGDLRRAVFTRLKQKYSPRLSPPLLRRVLDDAIEIAQETGFPNLFLPAVAEEKARLVYSSLHHEEIVDHPRSLRTAA